MKTLILLLIFSSVLYSCNSSESESKEEIAEKSPETENKVMGIEGITNVTTSGTPKNYTFSVTIKSPDTGCKQYADWWEVIDTEGNLIYRRILAHSHVPEQPFTRSGGKVQVNSDTKLIIRAHMNNTGYLPRVFTGNIVDGFFTLKMDTAKFSEAAKKEPLPSGCAF